MKVYKGYEIVKAIANGEIEDGTKFKVLYNSNRQRKNYDLNNVIYHENRIMWDNEELDLREPVTLDTLLQVEKFELIEEDKPIEKTKGFYFKEEFCVDDKQAKILNDMSFEYGNRIDLLIDAVNKLNKESGK